MNAPENIEVESIAEVKPLEVRIVPLSSADAKALFIDRYHELLLERAMQVEIAA